MRRPVRILLAEDNRGDVFLVREALHEYDVVHELIVVSDGEETEQYMEQIATREEVACPDLFLLDLNLPKGDGHELLRAFRSIPKCNAAPVIVITSSDSPTDRARAAEFGATHYFRKPSNLDDFLLLGELACRVLEEAGKL